MGEEADKAREQGQGAAKKAERELSAEERRGLEEQWSMPEQEPKRTLKATKKLKGGFDP